MGNIEAALKHQRCHLDLARSVRDHAEEQRALATIGRTYLFRYESDQSRGSLEQAEEAFRKSLSIVDDRLEGTVPQREISEMKARLFLNLGLVCDHLGEPKRCSEFIRRSVFIAERSQLLEDLYRANFNLGNIYFRHGQHSNSVRCLEQAKECARKIKDKFSESECFNCIGKVQLSLGDFVAARRSLKKALLLGSQQPLDRLAVKKAFKYAHQGCKLEEELGEDQGNKLGSHQAVGLAEQLGDLYCKVGCYSKALDAYQAQLKGAEALGKPARELAVIHVSLAATCTDLRQHSRAVEHYRRELALRQGSPTEECSTWLNIAAAQEESGCALEETDSSYSSASRLADQSAQARLQKRVLRLWLASQRRRGSSQAEDTEARLQELCAAEGWSPDGSDGEEDEEEEMDNSELLEDSDVNLSESDDDLEGYDKMVSGRRKAGRWNKRNEKGETSLHRACIDGNLKQAQYLMEQGHPVNPRDYCGWTPLHEASNHGHYDIVALLLEHGANVNDPGGPLCDGVTPLHDALACGNLRVGRLLVERGASVTQRNSKGDSPMDTLRHWQRTYSRELDQDTKQECMATERLLRKALSGRVAAAPAPAKPFDALQDSQLFDAENSEPLSPLQKAVPLEGGVLPAKAGPEQTGTLRARGTEAAVLYGNNFSSSDDSDSEHAVSPLRGVRPRHSFPAAPSQKEVPVNKEANPIPISGRETLREAPAPSPQFSSTPAVSSSSKSALVPEEEYLADEWLEDDLGELQPKKKRRLRVEQNGARGEDSVLSSTSRSQHRLFISDSFRASSVPSSSSRGLSLNRNGSQKPQQVKMTQMPGMVRLGRREVNRSHSPTVTDDEDMRPETPPPPHIHMHMQPPTHTLAAPMPTSMPPPIRMRVRVQEDVFLIPVPQSEADSCTVSWLCEQAAQRYYQKCGLLPRLSLQKEGALLCPQDLLLAVLHTNEEVLAEVCSWDLPPLPERYKKACNSLAVEENRRVTRLCEVQDGSSSVSVCGLSLAPPSLNPLLRALKLQASLTELRISGNRLHDNLLPELVATTITMPRLRLLDISANGITGEGLEKACLEELDLSLNQLGDGVSESLSCLLSCCPLLARLSLQGCGLTARFLQQHRLLLANALSGTGHLKSVCLSHNALGSTGFELVLKTLPLHSLTHLDLSAVRRGPADSPALEPLAKILSQEECSLTHLSLAANGLTDSSEASSINRSLMCLGQVIMALVDVSNGNRHICYRESKLTFLLRDSLGGNAKTYIIANVHPGSKCFGETLSTLQFAQRAKLIKNKAVINEDTQGNVRQLQAEVKKLKELLAQAVTSPGGDYGRDVAPGGPGFPIDIQPKGSYKAKFMAAARLWKKCEDERRMLLNKVAQLEVAWTQKDKFIHSSRMIVKFREDHIYRLEKKLKAEPGLVSDKESQVVIDQLKDEIKILRDQVEHHPKMTRYAAENFALREENRQLRSLPSVVNAEEAATQVTADLEDHFHRAMETERRTEGASSTPVAVDSASAAAIEKLKAQLLQKQTDLTGALQAYEDYKEVTKKQMSQLQSEKRYLDKSNRHLENILEATNAYKKKEVSELNRIHVETIKILTTPTKAYNLRTSLVPFSSPEHLNGSDQGTDDLWSEPPPLDMAEMAVTEELCQVQEQASHFQTQFNEEEMKNSKLQQQIAKLEEQITVMSQESDHKDELLSTERANRNTDQLNRQETANELQQSLQSEQQAAEVLGTEIRDLRLVLQSSDKELAAVRSELREGHSEQQRETTQLSSSLISTQLQLDKIQLEWEQLLEQHRTLQDSCDQLQAEAKFDADQAQQQLQDRQQEIDQLKAQLTELNSSLQMEQEHTSTLISQLTENKESTSKELIETMEQNTQLRKQVSDLTVQNQQQASKIVDLEQNSNSANETIKGLEQKTEQDKDFVVDLINQTRDLRSELSQKDQTIVHLCEDINDITAKYNDACFEREDLQGQNSKIQAEICDLKENVERQVASNKIEVEVLQEEVVYATEEVERLTKVLDEQNSLLQEQTAQKDIMIQNLQQKLQKQQEAVERTIRNGHFKPLVDLTGTPKSLPRTPCTPGSFSRDLSHVLESQERELENRRSSMITMEILLAELNAERAAKNDEIQRLKMQLTEKEMVRIEIQVLLDQFYNKENQLIHNGNNKSDELNDAFKKTMLKELQEERADKSNIMQQLSETQKRLQAQESLLGQSQTCVQELTNELGQRTQEDEKCVQENELLRKQNVKLSEENGKLVGHKNHKQRIEYLVNLKKDNTKLQEENEKLKTEMILMRDNVGCLSLEMI
ncbi:Tonsoku-like protein [Dissostichus eleginoides]|uniref:Tonsoku-like protein n=1 Tax=Dissostichus eleginoides TaxID=100907 RepID=A0AAD9C5A7_DISEL|nr:Tonsoku-like protein [Dissostichus eleginoides]